VNIVELSILLFIIGCGCVCGRYAAMFLGPVGWAAAPIASAIVYWMYGLWVRWLFRNDPLVNPKNADPDVGTRDNTITN